MESIKPGDKVAIVAPSASIASVFPKIFELGLSRIRETFKLDPVIMDSVLNPKASQEAKATDFHRALKNKNVKGLIALIGGNSQSGLIEHLSADIFQENPKLFFGYSDNTHLCNFMFKLGLPSFYGASLMTQFAMQGRMYPSTVRSIRWAFEDRQQIELLPDQFFTDLDLPWDVPENVHKTRPEEEDLLGGYCFGGNGRVEGKLWGGCLETLENLLAMPGRAPAWQDLQGAVLFLETAENIPSRDRVEKFMTSLGDAGLLGKLGGLALGRPKAWFFDRQLNLEERTTYRADQQDIVWRVFHKYNPGAPIVTNMNFGHTDPQLVLPYGGIMTIDVPSKKVLVKID